MTSPRVAKTIACGQCGHPLPWAMFNESDFRPCPHCGTGTLATVWPAFLKDPPKGEPAATLATDTEATCYFHADRRAAGVCEQCGRFLCALCDIALAGRHLCPACLSSGRRKGRLDGLDHTRTLHDTLALALAAVPVVSIVTAPMAIYLTIRHWNNPTSLLPRTRVRYHLALALAGIQLIFWPLLFLALARL